MNKFFTLLITLIFSSNGMAQMGTEEQQIKKIFIDFMHYYQANEKKFDSFQLHKGTGKNSLPPFHIQWNEVDRYIGFLRKSVPYVGEAYRENEKKDFRFYDSCYKDNPKDELAVGFDFDRWCGGQETTEYMVKWNTDKNNIYRVKIEGNNAELLIGSPLWKGSKEKERLWSKVPFKKEKGVWVMAGNIDSVEEDKQK
jgi:hypothetical protein